MSDREFVSDTFDKLALKDRDYQGFTLDDDGYVARRTLSKGEFTVSGLSKGLLITTMLVLDTAIAIPSTPLADRNTISLINLGTNTIYLGGATVTADRAIGTTAGWEIGPNEGINFDVKGVVVIYGVCEPGNSTLLKIMEIA